MTLPVFLINLDGSDDRLALATAQLERARLPFTRVPAFDGRAVDPLSYPDYDAGATVRHIGRQMTGGELGCTLSHRDCVTRFLETDAPYGVVLEDDAILAEGFGQTVQDILQWLEEDGRDWDLINIGAGRLKISSQIHRFETVSGAVDLKHAHYFPMLTSGLIWSRRGAELVAHDTRKVFAPADTYLRDLMATTNRGFAVWPPLVRQNVETTSDITSGGPERRTLGRSRAYRFYKQRRLWADKLTALKNKYF